MSGSQQTLAEGPKAKTTLAQSALALARKALRALLRTLVLVAPFLAPFVAAAILAPGTPPMKFLSEHLGLLVIPLLPIITCAAYASKNRRRVHPPKNKQGRPIRPPQPPLLGLGQRLKDIADIVANLDAIPWRISYLVVFLASVIIPAVYFPVSVAQITTLASDFQAHQASLRDVLVGVLAPSLAYMLVHFRTSGVLDRRQGVVQRYYEIARYNLEYPKTMPRSGGTRLTMRLLTPHLAIDVKKWAGLYDVDVFFVLAPESLSIDDMKKWDAFDMNLNAKMDRKEEWRVQRDPRGAGATVGPANYATAVLWDGEYDEDPLIYYIGRNLEDNTREVITLNETSPHAAVSGGTSSGKTSFAEIVAAQVLVKPMPWDPTLHGMVVIIDPKGPFARRWRGRPGVIVADGQQDAAEADDDGNPITGPQVMAAAMQWIEDEHQRRAAILAKYPDVATWIHLPPEVLKEERFFPILVILDEYIDHTDMERANGDERIERENNARAFTTRTASWQARKYRNVGMHTILIAQRVNMAVIGNVLMTNLPMRVVTGQMDDTQLRTMFGDRDDIPSLPSTRVVIENGERRTKTIPGRARVMNAGGQAINKVQIAWFGGKTNSETLDKWLPRGDVPPNGDFTIPEGNPRTAADFDAEGNLIERPATSAPEVDAPTDDEPAPTVAAPVPADDGTLDIPDTEVFPDEDWGAPVGGYDGPGPDAGVFPAAEAARCGVEGCVNDAAGACPSCAVPTCRAHLGVDPSGDGPMCLTCQREHTVYATEDFETVYKEIVTATEPPQRGLALTVTDADGLATATVRLATGKLIDITMDSNTGTVTSRSRTGTHTGRTDVLDHIQEVIANHDRTLAEKAAKTGGGA